MCCSSRAYRWLQDGGKGGAKHGGRKCVDKPFNGTYGTCQTYGSKKWCKGDGTVRLCPTMGEAV